MPRTTHTLRFVRRPGRAGYWQAWVNGKPRYFGTDEKAAKQRLRAMLAESMPIVAESSTVGGAVQSWLSTRPGQRSDWLKPWLVQYQRHRLDALGLDHLAEFYAHLKAATYIVERRIGKRLVKQRRKYSPKTIRHYLGAARTVLRFAKDRGWIEFVPAMPKTDRPRRAPKDLPVVDVLACLAKVRRPTRPILTFIFATGCRPGEACAARWEHYRPKADCIVLPAELHKTGHASGESRTIYLTPTAKQIVESQPRARETIFLNARKVPHTPGGLRQACAKSGIGKTYALRHTFAMKALETVDLFTLSKLLGHSSVATTQIYARVVDQRARVAANSLGDAFPLPPAGRTVTRAEARRVHA